jgi:hypothetical protein
MCLPVFRLFWVSSLAYPNLLGTKGYVVVVVCLCLHTDHVYWVGDIWALGINLEDLGNQRNGSPPTPLVVWTADRLARRGLPHLMQHLLCEQEDETIYHILSSCEFSRTIWLLLFHHYRLPDVLPFPGDKGFFDSWIRIIIFFPREAKWWLNSLITLGA